MLGPVTGTCTGSNILADPTGKKWYDGIRAGNGMEVAMEIIDSFSRGTFPDKIMYWPDSTAYRDAWMRTIDAAEKYNEPGRFTAIIGYEWTSQVPPGQNLHRVVVYRDGADKARRTVPATTYPPQGSTDPEYLWKLLQAYEDTTDANTRQPAAVGYDKGVPMGGDLRDAPSGKAPTFLAAALKDPIGGNLDRIQIIKGWQDGDELEERIYDVAVSDGRTIGSDGRCTTPVGDTVDVANATWSNSIGDTEMITVWTDPDFDPGQRAFSYVRGLEIPTPRWTAYDAKYFGLTDLDPEIPMTTQERVYTSPIWYTP